MQETTIILTTSKPSAKHSAIGRTRYFVSASGSLGGGTFTIEAFSPKLNQSDVITDLTPALAYVFTSDDPYLDFIVSGAAGAVGVTITAIPIITLDRLA